MLDKEGKNLDTVNVGTPDHMHAPMAMSAMQLGLHVYVQKPMAHDIYEVRRLTELAREKKLVTQMGIQIHSSAYYRMGVEVIQERGHRQDQGSPPVDGPQVGRSGPAAHPQRPRARRAQLGPLAGRLRPRPFMAGYYHPGNWRKRLDFGTGTFGDMGCHIFDPVFEALALGAPLSVRSEGPAATSWNWAIDAIIHYEFPGTQYTEGPTVKLTWYDGDERPPQEVLALLGDQPRPDNGSIFIGTKGVMLLPHIAVPFLLPKAQFKDYQMPKVTGTSHNDQFIDAVLGKGTTSTPFDYSGPLTESVLLGAVSTFSRTRRSSGTRRAEVQEPSRSQPPRPADLPPRLGGGGAELAINGISAVFDAV